jgi:hypothetical protein
MIVLSCSIGTMILTEPLTIALGFFLLGAGTGALTTAALYVEQIRQLKDLLEAAAHNNSQTAKQDHKSDGRKSA